MKATLLHKICREMLYPDLKILGFCRKGSRYLRQIESGVMHLIDIGKDPHGAETFGVLCGVNAIQINEEPMIGVGYIKESNRIHLTINGWNTNSARWPCETEEEARASLTQARHLILDLAIPWLDTHKTLSSVADEINIPAMVLLGWMKAKLYALDGDFSRAYVAIDDYTEWAKQPRRWGTAEHQQEDIDLAAKTRKEIEEMERRAKQRI